MARAAVVMAAAIGSGGEAPVARVAQGWRRERRRAPELEVVRGGDGEGRAEDGHVAGDGGQQEQHALAELDHDLILVADLPWKSRQGVRGFGVGMEGACPGRATPTNWRCGRAARQLSAPHPGHTQTLPSGNHFCARHGGGQSQGLWRLQRPRRGCGRSLWPAHEMRGHFSHKPRCRGPCHLAASARRTKSVHEGREG